jgi:hypothetical protein
LPVGTEKRLVATDWVNDGQAGTTQHGVLKHRHALFIGPTVIQSRDHCLDAVSKRVCTCSDYPGNAAHVLLL